MGNAYGIETKEWQWAVRWGLVVVALSLLPYLAVWALTPDTWRFAGIIVNPYDGHSYFAKMAQGAAGKWLFHLTYTPEPHDGAFIFTFYLALGHLTRLTGWPAPLVFHLARLAASLLLLLVVFRLICRVTNRPAERRLAYIFTLTASGLGWLGAIFGTLPIDLWVPEAFVPYSILANPHFPLGMALMVLIFDQLLAAGRDWLAVGRISLTALALAMILPFGLLTVWAVLALYLLWRYFAANRRLPWTEIWLTLGVVVGALPVIFYQYWVSTTNPVLAGWGAQNVTPAPKLIDLVLGYGLIGLLAIAGAITITRRGNIRRPEGLVLLWAGTTIFLVYVPFELQRRLITGLHIPLCILAAIGLNRWLQRSKLTPARQRLGRRFVIGLSLLGTVFVWSLPIFGALSSPAQSPTTARLFIRHEEQAAFDWLRVHTAPDNVVLASPRMGMFVPGQTGARAFYGHPFESINAADKEEQVIDFYQGRLEMVTPPADYIIVGPSEAEIGQPAALQRLPKVFEANGVVIYHNQ